MRLRQFLLHQTTTTQDEFVRSVDHAFLVVNTPSTVEDGMREFHTKEASQAREELRRAQDQAEIHPLSSSKGNGLAKITVGRTSINDIVLAHDAVSKFHAFFRRDGGFCYSLCDPGSKNGTTVNGRRLAAGQPLRLEGGETILFGQAIEATFHTAETLYRHLRMLRLWTQP